MKSFNITLYYIILLNIGYKHDIVHFESHDLNVVVLTIWLAREISSMTEFVLD